LRREAVGAHEPLAAGRAQVSDLARRHLDPPGNLAATADTVIVPALETKTLEEVHAVMSRSRLILSLDNQPQTPSSDVVTSQEPHAGATARAGTAVTIRFGAGLTR